MSDDTKAAEAAEKKADAESQKAKTYEESYVKELIAERDKAKAKLREISEKEKQAAEAKAIEEGKVKELLAARESELAEARKKLEAVETAKQEKRQRALDKVTDPAMRKFAEKMTDAEEINEFLEVMAEKKLTTHTGKQPSTAPERPKFKSGHEWQKEMIKQGVGD